MSREKEQAVDSLRSLATKKFSDVVLAGDPYRWEGFKGAIREYVIKGKAIGPVDKELVEYILNDEDVNGNSVLHVAAKLGDIEFLNIWVDKLKFELEELNDKNETALHVAAKHGRLEFVELLIVKMGKEFIEQESNQKETALRVAIRCGQTDVAKFLIEGDYFDLQKKEGPFDFAAKEDNLEVVKSCLGKLGLEGRHVSRVFRCALESKSKEVTQYLVKEVNDSDFGIDALVSFTTLIGDHSFDEGHMQLALDLELFDFKNRGMVFVRHAAECANFNALKVLIENGAPFDEERVKFSKVSMGDMRNFSSWLDEFRAKGAAGVDGVEGISAETLSAGGVEVGDPQAGEGPPPRREPSAAPAADGGEALASGSVSLDEKGEEVFWF